MDQAVENYKLLTEARERLGRALEAATSPQEKTALQRRARQEFEAAGGHVPGKGNFLFGKKLQIARPYGFFLDDWPEAEREEMRSEVLAIREQFYKQNPDAERVASLFSDDYSEESYP